MIRNEYLRFMKTLVSDDTLINVRKLANIIFNHLEEISPLGTASGRRVQKVVELALKEFQTASSECLTEVEIGETVFSGISSLKSLTVGPFRGFAKQEVFDLDSQIVLIYGPNGTGKSSFCEALEYSLLGSVVEADSKRFRDAREYLKNAHLDQFDAPILKANVSDTETITVNANEAQFRFCFVEKTRIDNFSRIAAHAPARQTELISTLFGLDNFNEFVKGFTTDIDDKYIDRVGKKALQLAEKRQKLETDRQIIKQNTQILKDLATEEQETADLYQKKMLFADFVPALGTTDEPGEIQAIETELENPTPILSNLKHADLLIAKTVVEKVILELKAKELELTKHSEELSYKQLHEAVIALSVLSQENCPACKTPLSQTTENPFELAKDGLSKLKHLSILEQQRDELKTSQHEAIKTIYKILKTTYHLIKNDEQPNPLQTSLVDNESLINTVWWETLIHVDDQNDSTWLQLKQQVKQLEAVDKNKSKALTERQQKTDRLKKLRKLREKVTELKTKRETLEAGITTAQKAITAFEEENKTLIETVENEKAIVNLNKEISVAYKQLVNMLNSYKDSLPSLLVADLGELVVKLYNAFNRSDASNDLLADLKLPVSSGERIRISFVNNADTYFDALHVLSEGHIRCVGLAILLAKNLKENHPIVIFDDPINAIDDDHRESIRRTLFEDDYFQEKQVILTCHGEEFFKDIQNLLGSEKSKASKRLTFLPQHGDKHIRIDFNSAPRNYVAAAQEHFEKLEIRNSLEKARQALESLAKGKVWRYVSKNGDGNLSIKLRTATTPIELRNLTEQLKKKLSQSSFTNANKEAVLSPISNLLGISGESREWHYLNKGTHEEADRDEFDHSTVKEIIDSLSTLDSVLS